MVNLHNFSTAVPQLIDTINTVEMVPLVLVQKHQNIERNGKEKLTMHQNSAFR